MGLRSFLKNTARALGLRARVSTSNAQRDTADSHVLNRIEQQITEATTSRDSLELLNLWHQLSLWKATPPKVALLKQRLAHLFEEFEGQRVNPNASSSTILVLVSQIASRQTDQRHQADQERGARQAEAQRTASEGERLKQEQEQERRVKEESARLAQEAEAQRAGLEAKRLAREAAIQRQAEVQQGKDEWARQQAEVERIRQEQKQLARQEAERLAHEKKAQQEVKVERLRQQQERRAKQESERRVREAKAQREADADRLRQEQDRQLSDFDLEPLAEDVVLLQSLDPDNPSKDAPRQATPNWLNKPLHDLSLSTRTGNSLYYGGFNTVADLAGKQQKDLLNIRNFGHKSLDELILALERQGIPFPVPPKPRDGLR